MASELQLEYRGYRVVIVPGYHGIAGRVHLKNGSHIHVYGWDCEEFQRHFRWTVDDIYSENLENR
jgi:hypothetical protein